MRSVEIPGGTALLRARGEFTVAGARGIAKATRHIRKDILDPALSEGEKDALGFPVALPDEDIEATWEFSDAILLARLASWTLNEPLPRSREQLGELPGDVYAALHSAIADMQRDERGDSDDELVDEFTVDAVEDPDAPTGA